MEYIDRDFNHISILDERTGLVELINHAGINRIQSETAIYVKHIHNYINDRTRLHKSALEGFSSYLSADMSVSDGE